MSRARDQRRRARRDLHIDRAVPALYLADASATPVEVTVRVHTKFNALGALPGGGTTNAYAERVEQQPRVIFFRDPDIDGSITAVRNHAYVSVEAGEAYRIVTSTSGDLTITAEVNAIPADLLATLGLPVPQ